MISFWHHVLIVVSDTILYFSVDATQSNQAGKYINGAKVGNCKLTLIDVDGTPRIVLKVFSILRTPVCINWDIFEHHDVEDSM